MLLYFAILGYLMTIVNGASLKQRRTEVGMCNLKPGQPVGYGVFCQTIDKNLCNSYGSFCKWSSSGTPPVKTGCILKTGVDENYGSYCEGKSEPDCEIFRNFCTYSRDGTIRDYQCTVKAGLEGYESYCIQNAFNEEGCKGYLRYTSFCDWASPIDGELTQWTEWSSCDVECDGGSRTRSRTCTNPSPQHGGADCADSRNEIQDCNTHSCPVDGGWTQWTEWSSCDSKCDGGSQTRSRKCANPSPQHGGADCIGNRIEIQGCNNHSCPIDGGLTQWSEWSTCDAECNGGSQTRGRTCTNPIPQHGGVDCLDDRSEIQDCNTHSCPIDGGLTQWTDWSSCDAECNGGSQTRSRTCTNPSPQYGGVDCLDNRSEFQDCNTHSCPINGGLTQWTEWSSCDSECNGGSQTRSRTCTNPSPQHGGADCLDNLSDRQNCNLQACTSCQMYNTPISFSSGSFLCGDQDNCENMGIKKVGQIARYTYYDRVGYYNRAAEGPVEVFFGTPVRSVTVELPYIGQLDQRITIFDCDGNVIESRVDPIEIDSIHFQTFSQAQPIIAKMTVEEDVPLYLAAILNITVWSALTR